jgi:heme oxygenase
VILLDRLKAETRLAHDRIEGAMALDWHLASPGRYRALLARFHGAHAGFEEEASEFVADPAFFDPRRKTGCIAHDLARLGLDGREAAALPRLRLDLRSRAEAYGAMYVLEGSTLGGALISRDVKRALGPDAPVAYFRAYGPRLGPMWKAFQARLLAVSGPDVDDAVVASAERTFALLQHWLCPERVR